MYQQAQQKPNYVQIKILIFLDYLYYDFDLLWVIGNSVNNLFSHVAPL